MRTAAEPALGVALAAARLLAANAPLQGEDRLQIEVLVRRLEQLAGTQGGPAASATGGAAGASDGTDSPAGASPPGREAGSARELLEDSLRDFSLVARERGAQLHARSLPERPIRTPPGLREALEKLLWELIRRLPAAAQLVVASDREAAAPGAGCLVLDVAVGPEAAADEGEAPAASRLGRPDLPGELVEELARCGARVGVREHAGRGQWLRLELEAADAKRAAPRVLIVDDSEYMRRRLASLLERHGFEVVAFAGSGDAAIAAYAQHHPDLVTLDLVMPGMSGHDTLVVLRQADPTAKVVVVSSVGQREQVIAAIRAGASKYILKPFEEKRVLEVVKDLTSGAERRRCPRVKPDEPLRATFTVDLATRRSALANLEDISETGVGLSLQHDVEIPLGEVVDARLHFPGKMLALKARIVWKRGCRLGMAFHELPPGLRELLRQFVEERLLAIETAEKEALGPVGPVGGGGRGD